MKGEIKRQMVHASGVFLLLPLVFFGRLTTSLLVSATIVILLLWGHYRKHHIYTIKPLIKWERKIEKFVSEYERSVEIKQPFMGAITFFIGSLIAMTLFPIGTAVASISILSVGDSVSTLVGKMYGKHKWPYGKKSFEGSFAFIIASTMIYYMFVGMPMALIFGAITTLVESLPKIDDNISIPVTVSILLTFF